MQERICGRAQRESARRGVTRSTFRSDPRPRFGTTCRQSESRPPFHHRFWHSEITCDDDKENMNYLGAEALHALARCSTSLDDQGSQASAESTRRTELIALRPIGKEEEKVMNLSPRQRPRPCSHMWITSDEKRDHVTVGVDVFFFYLLYNPL